MNLKEVKIEAMIYMIRMQKVMLDIDLAKLYGVETRRLKEQVKRNIERFPPDFLLQPNLSELADLRSQIATFNSISDQNYIFKHPPYLFTEYGVAMLSSILQSKEAIQVNISIMRTFARLRGAISNSNVREEIECFTNNTNKLFKIVFERLDSLEDEITPILPKKRKKIGLCGE